MHCPSNPITGMQRWFAGVAIACLAAACARAESEPGVLRPEVLLNSGCRIERGVIRLFDKIATQQGSGPIVLEAESGARLFFQEDVFARKAGDTTFLQIKRSGSEYTPQSDDPQASGEGYVDYLSSGVYPFAVRVEGEYTVWARHWVPVKGSWNYSHQLDAYPKAEVDLTPAIPAGKTWFWVRGQTRRLAPGTHTFVVADLHNGKRLDQVILSPDPDFVPPAAGLPASPAETVEEGSVLFRPVAPAGFARWGTFRFEIEPGKGRVEFAGSFDGGKTWRPMVSGDPITSGTEPALTLKATLRLVDGVGPVVRDVAVAFVPDEQSLVSLVSGTTRLDFSRATGCLTGLRNTKTGTWLITQGTRSEAFRVRLKAPGKPDIVEFTSADAALISFDQSGAGPMTATWGLLDNRVRIVCRVEAEPESGLFAWRVGVENDHPELDVIEVTAPILPPMRVGGADTANTLAWPNAAGEIIREPALRGDLLVKYIDHAGFPWLDLHSDGGEGFYAGMHDPQLIGTEIACKPGNDELTVRFSFRKAHRVRAGGGRIEYRYVLAAHEGDWHWAADTYRAFFRSLYPINRYTRWLREADAWMAGRAAGCGMRVPHDGGGIRREATYAELDWDFQNASFHGLSYVQGWGSLGDGACPTYYQPRLEMGGEKRFAEKLKQWRAAGGSIGYYFHGNALGAYYVLSPRYFGHPWADYPADARPPDWDWYLRNIHCPDETFAPNREALARAAAAFQEHFDSGKKMTGSMAEWSVDSYAPIRWTGGEFGDHLMKWIGKYVGEYGCNTAYLDTFSFFNAAPDFNPRLGNHGENDQAALKARFLESYFARMTALDPTFVSLTEGVADVFGSRLFFMLSGFDRTPNLMRYMLPDQIYFLGNANGLWSESLSRRSLSRSFVFGMKFDLVADTMPLFPHSWHLLKLRQRVSPFLNYAAFKDNVGVRAGAPGVLAYAHEVGEESAAFTGETGARAWTVTVWNEDRKAGPLVLRPPAGFRPARAFLCRLYRDPIPLPFELRDGEIALELPRAETAALVFVERAAGPLAWTAVPVQTGPGTVEVSIFNFSGEPISLSFREISGRTRFTDLPESVPAEPGEMTIVRLTDAAPSEAFKTATLRISAPDYSRDLMISLGRTDGVIPPIPADAE